MTPPIDYATPGIFTDLSAFPKEVLAAHGSTPAEICFPVHSLVIQPHAAAALGLPSERLAEKDIRPAAKIVETLLALDASPLTTPRDPEKRVVGTCRHFAVLSCALLRHHGIRSRARCGFATYFQAGRGVDHWITEYWDQDRGSWIRIDSEIIGQGVLDQPEDLQPGQFLSGGEAWTAHRRGEIDASVYGVFGTENWGVGEIRGNAVKDLAALNKVETLPWDEWGQMTDAYESRTGPEYDDLLDVLATVCASDDGEAIAELYARDDFRVPAELIA